MDVLLDRLRETYSQRAVSIVAAGGNLVASVGPIRAPTWTAAAHRRRGRRPRRSFWLLLAGPTLTARDRRVLGAVAEQAVNTVLSRR